MTKISLTPVIDIVFILLIFFMLATNFNKVGEVNMDMTKESTSSSKEDIKLIKFYWPISNFFNKQDWFWKPIELSSVLFNLVKK